MTNTTPAQQEALDALHVAAVERQLYVLRGPAAILRAVDHRLINRVHGLADAVRLTGYPLDLDAVLAAAEAAALDQALLG